MTHTARLFIAATAIALTLELPCTAATIYPGDDGFDAIDLGSGQDAYGIIGYGTAGNPSFGGLSGTAANGSFLSYFNVAGPTAASNGNRNGGARSSAGQAGYVQAGGILPFYFTLAPGFATIYFDLQQAKTAATQSLSVSLFEIGGSQNDVQYFTTRSTTSFIRAGTIPMSVTGGSYGLWFGGTNVQSDSIAFIDNVRVENTDTPEEEPGLRPGNPVLPISGTTGQFQNAPSGRWFDPDLVDGYDFATTDGSKFDAILGFAPGFDATMIVIANGQTLGPFGPDDSVDFVSIFGSGVDSFRVEGISPLVDPTDPQAFPIQLAFDREFVDFTMTPIPEPASLSLLAVVGLAMLRRRGR